MLKISVQKIILLTMLTLLSSCAYAQDVKECQECNNINNSLDVIDIQTMKSSVKIIDIVENDAEHTQLIYFVLSSDIFYLEYNSNFKVGDIIEVSIDTKFDYETNSFKLIQMYLE